LVKLIRLDQKTPPVDVVFEIFEVLGENLFEKMIFEEKIQMKEIEQDPSSTQIEKLIKLIGKNIEEENKFILRVKVSFVKTQEDIFFEDKLKEKDSINEQKIQISIEPICSLVYSQLIPLHGLNQKYSLSILLSEFPYGLYLVKIYTRETEIKSKIIVKKNENENEFSARFSVYPMDLLDNKREKIQLELTSTKEFQQFQVFIFEILDKTIVEKKMEKDFLFIKETVESTIKSGGYLKDDLDFIEKTSIEFRNKFQDHKQVNRKIKILMTEFEKETPKLIKKLARKIELEAQLKLHLDKRNRIEIKKYLVYCTESYPNELLELIKRAKEVLEEIEGEWKIKNQIIIILENQMISIKSLFGSGRSDLSLVGFQNQRINLLNESKRIYPHFDSVVLFILEAWVELNSTESPSVLMNRLVLLLNYLEDDEDKKTEFESYRIDLEETDRSTVKDILRYLINELTKKSPILKLEQEKEIQEEISKKEEIQEEINVKEKKDKLDTSELDESGICEKLDEIYENLVKPFLLTVLVGHLS
jgi:hypothetical protein